MASVTITASFPGSHVAKPFPMLLDNPQYEATVTPGVAFGAANLVLAAATAKRLLLVQYDDQIQLAVLTVGQVIGDVVPITLRTNGAALASYALMLNPSVVGVYVKAP